nr:hypothetical protein CFP56_54511 [Quercus suber]
MTLADPELQCTTRRFSRGALNVEIYQSDVSGSFFEDHPNNRTNVACITLPLRAMLGGYAEMAILSRRVDASSEHSQILYAAQLPVQITLTTSLRTRNKADGSISGILGIMQGVAEEDN